METPGAKFVSMIMDRLQALEGETQRQSDKIDALEARALELEIQAHKPLLASPGIISEQLAFSDGTTIHWAIGRPAGMYVTNVLVPLAPPYGDVVIARGPLMLLADSDSDSDDGKTGRRRKRVVNINRKHLEGKQTKTLTLT